MVEANEQEGADVESKEAANVPGMGPTSSLLTFSKSEF